MNTLAHRRLTCCFGLVISAFCFATKRNLKHALVFVVSLLGMGAILGFVAPPQFFQARAFHQPDHASDLRITGLSLSSASVSPGQQVSITVYGWRVFRMYIHGTGPLNVGDPVGTYNPSQPLAPNEFYRFNGEADPPFTLPGADAVVTYPLTAPSQPGLYPIVANAGREVNIPQPVCAWDNVLYWIDIFSQQQFDFCNNVSPVYLEVVNPTPTPGPGSFSLTASPLNFTLPATGTVTVTYNASASLPGESLNHIQIWTARWDGSSPIANTWTQFDGDFPCNGPSCQVPSQSDFYGLSDAGQWIVEMEVFYNDPSLGVQLWCSGNPASTDFCGTSAYKIVTAVAPTSTPTPTPPPPTQCGDGCCQFGEDSTCPSDCPWGPPTNCSNLCNPDPAGCWYDIPDCPGSTCNQTTCTCDVTTTCSMDNQNCTTDAECQAPGPECAVYACTPVTSTRSVCLSTSVTPLPTSTPTPPSSIALFARVDGPSCGQVTQQITYTATARGVSLVGLEIFVSETSPISWTNIGGGPDVCSTQTDRTTCSVTGSWTPTAPGQYYVVVNAYDDTNGDGVASPSESCTGAPNFPAGWLNCSADELIRVNVTDSTASCSMAGVGCVTDDNCRPTCEAVSCAQYVCDPPGRGICVVGSPSPTPAPTATPFEPEFCTPGDPNSGIRTGLGCLPTEIAGLIGRVVGIVLGFAGGIALLLIIYSGYRMITGGGNPEALQGAKETLTAAIIGLLFVIFSFVILEVVAVDVLCIPGFGSC